MRKRSQLFGQAGNFSKSSSKLKSWDLSDVATSAACCCCAANFSLRKRAILYTLLRCQKNGAFGAVLASHSPTTCFYDFSVRSHRAEAVQRSSCSHYAQFNYAIHRPGCAPRRPNQRIFLQEVVQKARFTRPKHSVMAYWNANVRLRSNRGPARALHAKAHTGPGVLRRFSRGFFRQKHKRNYSGAFRAGCPRQLPHRCLRQVGGTAVKSPAFSSQLEVVPFAVDSKKSSNFPGKKNLMIPSLGQSPAVNSCNRIAEI